MPPKRGRFLRGEDGRAWLAAHPKAQARLIREGSRYRDPRTGHTFSPRQVLRVTTGYTPESLAVERRFQMSGAKDAGEDLERLIESYRRAETQRRGRKTLLPRKDVVKADSPFWTLLRGLRSSDTKPSGAKARALVALGLRDKESRVRVGNSPKGERPTTTRTRSQLSRRARITGRG